MNQLSNIVVDLVRYRRADGAARGLTAPDVGRPARRFAHLPLAARRRHWSPHLLLDHTEGIARSAASLATLSCSLKDLKHEQPPE
jgi:hypothetical protein